MPHIVPPQTERNTRSYQGVRHARLTRSMTRLTPALKAVLIELRYRLCDGESAAISNRQLAQATGYSEGYISVLMRQLAGETVTIKQQQRTLSYPGVAQPFITRTWDGAKGRFIITMLPPPELRPALPQKHVDSSTAISAHPQADTSRPDEAAMIQLALFDVPASMGDHAYDPLPATVFSSPESDKKPEDGDQTHDPDLQRHDYAAAMQQTGDDEHAASTRSTPPPPTFTLPDAWPAMLQGTPGYSHADYARDLQKAATRQLRGHPDQLISWSVSRGQPVYSADELRRARTGAFYADRRRDSHDSTQRNRPTDRRAAGCRAVHAASGYAAPAASAAHRRTSAHVGVDTSECGAPLAELPAFLRSGTGQDDQPVAPIPQTALPASPTLNSPTSCACPRCDGAGYYALAVPVGHPQFGQLLPCQCTLSRRAQRCQEQLQMPVTQRLHERDCRLESVDLHRPLQGVLHWEGQTIDGPQQRQALYEAHRIASEYAAEPQGWLYLYGPPGSGKTRLAASIANAFRDRGIAATYGRIQALLDWLKAGFRGQDAVDFDQRVQLLERAPLLLIDDLGTEHGTTWERVMLENLLNARYNRQLPTILTSNPE